MWAFIGIVLFLLLFHFLRYELPHILVRRDLKKRWKKDPYGVMLTGHVRLGLTRKGKSTASLHL